MEQPLPSKSPTYWLDMLRNAEHQLNWMERALLPAEAVHWLHLHPEDHAAEQLLELLAHDSKWEVRLAVGRRMDEIPDPLFSRVAEAMGEDHNAYVSGAVKRAVKERTSRRRRSSARHPGRAQNLQEIEKLYDQNAAIMASKVADERSSELLRSVAHDLKAIAARIKIGSSGLRKQDRMARPFEQSRGMIDHGVSDLESLVASIRALADPRALEMAMEDLCELLVAAVETAKAALRSQGHDIAPVEVSIHCADPVCALVSRSHILMAFSNLVKNAIESHGNLSGYQTGKVAITVSAAHEKVRVVVADDGCGLRHEDVATLNQFTPGHSSKPTGSGYGLPIAERYIDAHHGTLRLESEQGIGTTVIAEFPSEGEKSNAARTTGRR